MTESNRVLSPRKEAGALVRLGEAEKAAKTEYAEATTQAQEDKGGIRGSKLKDHAEINNHQQVPNSEQQTPRASIHQDEFAYEVRATGRGPVRDRRGDGPSRIRGIRGNERPHGGGRGLEWRVQRSRET